MQSGLLSFLSRPIRYSTSLMPPPRDVLQKRAWRLAYLLSAGDPGAATAILRSVLRSQPNLTAIDIAHLERLVILRARALTGTGGGRARRHRQDRSTPRPDAAAAPSAPPSDPAVDGAMGALAGLPFQA